MVSVYRLTPISMTLNLFFRLSILSISETLQKAQSTGTTRARIGLSDLKAIPLAVPPLPEQQKIAEIFSTVDEKITVIDEQIGQTQGLKKGLLQQLLTKGIGHAKFKPSPLGEIPERWEVVTFDQVVMNSTKKYNEPDGRCIELEHLQQESGKLLGYDDFAGKASVKNYFQEGDVLFANYDLT
jgi:type I restriction enzyme S subunit